MENMNKCPCCSHHCDRNNLQCGKGEAYFNGEATPDSGRSHENRRDKHHDHQDSERRSHHGGKHLGHRRPEFPANSLADLMARCAHRLFHGGDESMFAVLTGEESDKLKKLLSKLVSE